MEVQRSQDRSLSPGRERAAAATCILCCAVDCNGYRKEFAKLTLWNLEFMSIISNARRLYHEELNNEALVLNESDNKASNADKDNKLSVALANEVATSLGAHVGKKLKPQTVGVIFEARTCEFVRRTFLRLEHLRPGRWTIETVLATSKLPIAKFEQYKHLLVLDDVVSSQKELKSIIGQDYTIAPDIVIARQPVSDDEINDGAYLSIHLLSH